MKPFKVGERVKVYGNLRDSRRNEVLFVNGMPGTVADEEEKDGSITVKMDNPVFPDRGWVHIKQLRRLVKKPRREWWLRFSKSGEFYGLFYEEPANCESVHVREVREVKERK